MKDQTPQREFRVKSVTRIPTLKELMEAIEEIDHYRDILSDETVLNNFSVSALKRAKNHLDYLSQTIELGVSRYIKKEYLPGLSLKPCKN